MAMRYTPGQLREAAQISKEGFRYWRKAIAWLKPPARPRACFGPSELLAAAILKQLTDHGVPIGKLARVANDLVLACRQSGWMQLEWEVAWIDLHAGSARILAGLPPSLERLHLVVPLRPLILRMRQSLFDEKPDPQGELAMRPFAVAGAAS